VKKILVFITLVLFLNNLSAKTWYVNQASGNTVQNGYYWATALKNLRQAIDSTKAGDTIKVAAGTYIPGSSGDANFSIKSGTVLLGGYAASDSTKARNFSEYATILNGRYSTTTPFAQVDHVIKCVGVNTNTVIDGFIIENGYASGGSNNDPATGGGMLISANSNPRILNCLFRNNYASNNGGAIAITGNSSPDILNCIFVNNSSFQSGTVFLQNASGTRLINCVFADNSVQHGASALHITQSSISVTNNTFFRNAVEWPNTSADNATVIAEGGSILSLTNSIFFANKAKELVEAMELSASASTINISNCITQHYTQGTQVLLAVNPRFKDTANLAGPDNKFFTGDDGLQLTAPCSPALNTGNNAAIAGITTDIIAQPRLYNNGVVDLGAYEMQNTPATNLNLVYVNQTATGNNDGSSWTNAFTSLQQALLSCAETIKVAAGTYYPSNNNPASAFWLHSKLVILGGYPKTGNPSDAQRDPFTNISRLSGKIPGNTSQSGNVLFVDRVDSTCIVDGLTISDAVTPQYSFYQSGIRITNNSNPVFINCRIENNISDLGGAMQVSNQARPSFFACSFVNNKSRGAGHGEGGAFRADNAAMPYFKNCRFESNVVAATNILSGDGGAGNIDNAGAAFDSCQFTNNFANYYGGAVYVRGAFPVTFKNCTFAGNFAQEAGNSVYHNGANAAFYQCQFAEPGSTLYGGAVYNLNCSPLFEECVFKLCQARVGGAVYNNQSSPLFKKCVFAQNTSGKGGAMYNVDSRTVGFINCAASYNYSTNGSVFYNERSTVDIWSSTLTVNSGSSPVKNMDSSVLTVKNSIMWANALGVKELLATTFTDIENFTGAVRPSFSNVASSVTQFFGVNGTNNNIVGINPRLVNYNDADGPDNIFFTADDGLRLSPCSPLIDVGNNSYPTGIATDLQRKPRLFGTVIDIGAYEFGQPINTSNTIFVNAVATGTGDGSSWANAYTSFQDALSDICADTVKVAAGVYYAAATSVDSAFSVRYGRVMLAGYPATGNPSDKDRNPILYPTILSGNAGNKGDSLDNVNHVVSVMQADGKVILDGFIIEGGFSRYGNGNINENGGAGVQVITSDITIKNCTIQKNVATSYGGGMYISPSSVFNIEKTLIRNNRVGHSGGGISAGSAGTINNCAFVDNYSETQGGGLYTSGQNIQITNTVFHRNLAGFRAGGVYNDNPVNVKYVNCTFTRNVSSNWEGGGVYVQQTYQGSNALFYNTIFHENALGSQINLQFSDVYFSECGRSSDFCFYSKLFNCRMQGAYTITNPVNGYPAFVDIDNPAGKDGIWLTADDGLRLTHCSVCIDRGQNAVVNTTSKDIAGNDRIQYGTVDLGAYEYNSSLEGTAIVQKAADSVVANKEYTDSLGWTHYFKDCNYLLSIKNQSRNIGSLVNGTLKIGVVTNAGFGTSSALNLSNAAFNTSGGSLYGMNKYWYALSDYTITDSLQVRFPYATKDFEDVKSASQTITSHEQLSFYQARNSSSAHDLNIPASAVTVYQNDTAATLQHFKYFAQEGFHISEFYINQFGSGSAFISNNGPKPDLILTDITVPVNITRSADTFSLGFREKNSGTGRSGYHSAAIYLSPDSALNKTGNTDILLGSLNINQYLQAGEQTVVLQQKITIPCGTAAGNYYLIVSADNNNNVDEANENNNLYFKKLIMEVGPVKPAGLTIVSDHISDKACLGDSIKLTAQITSCVGCKFNWGTGDTTASTYVKANSTYYVSVTNACGQISQGKTVTFKYPPGIVPVADPTQICLGQTVKLYEMVGVDADSIVWSGPGLNNVTGPLISFQPTQSGNLVFTEKAYSNDRLCTTTKTITVRVLSTQMPTLQIAGNGCVAPYIFKVSSVANAGQTPRFVWYKNDTLLNMYDTVITFNNLSQGARIYAKMLPQNPCVKADTVQSNTITFNCAPTGIDDIPGISHFYIGPNPSTGNFVINLLFSMPKQVSWSVYNSYGSKVMEAAASLWSGNIQRSIDLSNMPTGMYHLQLVIDKQPFTYKLLVVR
jgi:predicted outer membrane repeat protein